MQSDYWKTKETAKDFKSWLSEWEDCLVCACDHGCNQWVKEQGHRAALLFRILSTKGNTSLERVTQIPLKEVDQIWYRIVTWESEKWNRDNRKQEASQAGLDAEYIGIDNIKNAVLKCDGDKRKAEDLLGLKKYTLAPIYAYVINKEES